MATSSFSIRYRPVRIGFLVREGEIDDVIKASETNTLLWGGIHNPIIPVSEDMDFPKQLIKLFNVDVLYAVSDSQGIQVLLDEYKYLKSPHNFSRQIFYEDWDTKKQVLGYLDIINIVNFYWETEFKNKSNRYKSRCTLVEWKKEDVLANLFAVLFGSFPQGFNLKYDYRNAFLKGLKARKAILRNAGSIDSKLSEVYYPLALTSDRLQGYADGFRQNGIYVGTSDSYEDLISFWNLRASGISLQFLPVDSDRLDAFIRQHLANLDKTPNQHHYIEDSIFVYTKDSDTAKAHLSAFKTKKKKLYSEVSNVSWNGLNINPTSYYFDHKQVLGSVDQRFDRYSVAIALPEKPVKEENRDHYLQDIVAVVDSIVEFEYPEHTLKLPFIQELNEFYSRQIVFDPWKLRVDKEGIGLIQRVSDSVVNLYPLSNIKLIEKVFDFAEIEAKMSQPGRLAYWIMHQMREDDPLEACRIFKIRGVRELIKGLSTKQSITWKEALKIIGSRDFTKFKQLYIEYREQSELRPQDVWNFLIKKHIFTPVLTRTQSTWRLFCSLPFFPSKKKSFKCERCGLKSNMPWQDFSKEWTCEFCGHEHYLPQFIGKEFRSNEIDAWNFKKSKLFGIDNNQEGAIPIILTLLQVKRRFLDDGFIYSTSFQLKPKNGSLCETDLVVLNYRRSDKIEIAIGECKSDGGEIDSKDIDNLKSIRERFESKGLECYLIFSKTADAFKEKELTLFKKLVQQKIYPVLFLNKELEPYDPYDEYQDTYLPRPHPFSLNDMAMNSWYIYLKN